MLRKKRPVWRRKTVYKNTAEVASLQDSIITIIVMGCADTHAALANVVDRRLRFQLENVTVCKQ